MSNLSVSPSPADDLPRMGGWNYRIIRFKPDWFVVCEVYYDEDGKPFGYTDGHAPGGNDENDCLGEFDLMAQAFRRDVLDVSEFPVPAPPTQSAVENSND